MREIKFRVWDNVVNCMYTPDQEPDMWRIKDAMNGVVLYPDGILMQFTGLKDKNGKHIYEGDVVKCHDHPTGIDDCITSVGFQEGCFVAKANGLALNVYGTAWTEVIGNIWENPELLKSMNNKLGI